MGFGGGRSEAAQAASLVSLDPMIFAAAPGLSEAVAEHEGAQGKCGGIGILSTRALGPEASQGLPSARATVLTGWGCRYYPLGTGETTLQQSTARERLPGLQAL